MHGLTLIWVLIVVIIIIGVIIKVVLPGLTKGKGDYPYQKEPVLFTPAERSFLGVLEQALGSQFRVMGKVRLLDIIRVKSGLSGSARQQAINRIQSKHIDFVVCNPNDLSVQFVIELDDSSHQQAQRQSRDEFVNKALETAGIPVFRFAVKRSYSVQDIRNAVFEPATTAGKA